MEKKSKHVDILVDGKVQGVHFRDTTQKQATLFSVKGIVKNLPTGQVFIEAEGAEDDLDKLLEWVHHGPPRAIVEK